MLPDPRKAGGGGDDPGQKETIGAYLWQALQVFGPLFCFL